MSLERVCAIDPVKVHAQAVSRHHLTAPLVPLARPVALLLVMEAFTSVDVKNYVYVV